MNRKIIALFVITLHILGVCSTYADSNYIMIVTSNQLSSNYYCKIDSGKYSIAEFRTGKDDKLYSVSTLINNLTKKLLSSKTSLQKVKSRLAGKLSAGERAKLEKQKKQLSARIADLNAIIPQARNCGRGQLKKPSKKPVFVYQTFSPSGNPNIQKVSTFLYGIMIDKPSDFALGTIYCALLPGARNVVKYVTDPDPYFEANTYNISQATYGNTFPGLKVPLQFFSGDFQTEGIIAPISKESKGKFFIAFAWGYVKETPGTCAKPFTCSVEALKNALQKQYGKITLESAVTKLSGATCDD